MIVATIGHEDYIIDSMADAETLMNIISRARPVDSHYTPSAGGEWTDAAGSSSLTIEITNKPYASQEAHEALQDEMRAKAAALKEAA